MKMTKGKKKIAYAVTALGLAGAIITGAMIQNASDVAATTKVFDGMKTQFSTDKPVQILEIVPNNTTDTVNYQDWQNTSVTINRQSELGYFMPFSIAKSCSVYSGGDGNESPQSIYYTSRGGALRSFAGDDATNYSNTLLNMYQYGLIKPSGADNGWYTAYSEYPIYGKSAIFSDTKNNTCSTEMQGDSLKSGFYSLQTNGAYKFDNTNHTYTLMSYQSTGNTSIPYGNYIFEVFTMPATGWPEEGDADYQAFTVSDNGIPGNEGGTNHYVLVDVDNSAQALPRRNDDKSAIITKVASGGTLGFTVAETDSQQNTYFGYSGMKLWYANKNVRMKNGDWWYEYVLGDLKAYEDAKSATVDNAYKTVAAADVTPDMIDAADLIYISGKSTAFVNGSTDISEDVLVEIYNKTVNEHKAVMMDYACYDSSSTSNVSKLAKLLWQADQKELMNDDANNSLFDIDTTTGVKELKATEIDNALSKLSGIVPTSSGNFVTGNTYVYNHRVGYFNNPKSKVDAFDNIANGDFISAYKASIASEGFSAVIAYIDSTNKNSITGTMSTDITPAVCIQYILCSDGTSLAVMKATLHVLEIQPVPAYLYNTQRGSEEYVALNDQVAAEKRVMDNRDAFVKDYLSDYYKDKVKYIQFTSMTVSEFNAINEDLVETYDIIYIGDETYRDGKYLYYPLGSARYTRQWTGTKYERKVVYDLSAFNDGNLTGNIYYNVGDAINVYALRYGEFGIGGWYATDYTNRTNSQTWNNNSIISARYTGRDITRNKLTKLKEFVDSQALVLVAEDLMGTPTGSVKNTQINPTIINDNNSDTHGRVDNSSNLYELLSYGLGDTYDASQGKYVSSKESAHNNVVAVSDIIQKYVAKEDLAVYVSTEKLDLSLTEAPVEYRYEVNPGLGYITKQYYLDTKHDDGTRYLNYKFSIITDSEKASVSGYSVALYVDINNDGKFSKTREIVDDVTIKVAATGEEAPKYGDNIDDKSGASDTENGTDENTPIDVNLANTYKLEPNVEYVMTRDISDEYCGILNWKIDIKSNAISYLHASKSGFTCVENETGKNKEVKILQITRGTSTTDDSSNLDLEAALYEYRINKSTTWKWGYYLSNVPGYDVYIRTMNVAEFERVFSAKYNVYKNSGGTLPVADYAVEKFFPEFVVQNYSGGNYTETPSTYRTQHDDRGRQITSRAWQNAGYTTDVVGVNMIVCGFGDSYNKFTNADALEALKAFIDSGKPVLTSHDFITYSSDNAQNRYLRNAFGNDLYASTQDITSGGLANAWLASGRGAPTNAGSNYLYAGVSATRAADAAKIVAMENVGREVAYLPNSMRNTTVPETSGHSNFILDAQRMTRYGNEGYSWINAYGAALGSRSDTGNLTGEQGSVLTRAMQQYTVEKINDGQITSYPYTIADNFKVTTTHSQYFALDLTSDLDDDGESDVVVWYALGASGTTSNSFDSRGRDPYSDKQGGSLDPANGFFIYSDGNITYTGAGHQDMQYAGDQEVQLFVNTLLAAFQVESTAPSAGWYDKTDVDATPITSLVIPYDGNITKPKKSDDPADSSILKNDKTDEYLYKFVDPNTQTGIAEGDKTLMYYRIKDNNFVRGTREITVRYLLTIATKDLYTKSGTAYTRATNDDLEGDGVLYGRLADGTYLQAEYRSIEGKGTWLVDVSGRINTYPVAGKSITATPLEKDAKDGYAVHGILSGKTYGVYLPMNQLNENAYFSLIIEAKTKITTVSTSQKEQTSETDVTYQPLYVGKMDLLDLD